MSVMDELRRLAAQICSDRCKYHAAMIPSEDDEEFERMVLQFCEDCPVMELLL